jgi:hypothetical protein
MLKHWLIAGALALGFVGAAEAQTYRDSGGTIPQGVVPLVGCASGGNCSGPVSAANPLPTQPSGNAVGAANFVTGQQTAVASSATLIVAARAGAAGTGRVSLTLYNQGSATVYYGPAGVTPSTGTPLLPGGSRTIATTAAIYGVVASGTGSIAYDETY